MLKQELGLLQECKLQIEEKLNWPESKYWRQRDFLNLIILIEKKTQITLSLTTIRRIWKHDYSRTPQPGTLDALAKFLEYDGWLEFAEIHQKPSGKLGSTIKTKKKTWKRIGYSAISIVLVGIIILGISNIVVTPNSSSSKASLSVRYASPLNVPNTVMFSYNLDGIDADSFFIQQSWNKFRREMVSKIDTIHTSTYYYPGAHQASLIANDEIVAQATLTIETDNWIALARSGMSDNIPTYISIDNHKRTDILSISGDQLQKYDLKLDQDLLLSYYYVNSFEGLDEDNFRLKIRLKNDSILSTACPKISLMILGTEDMHMIPLTTPGCIGNINLKIGNKTLKGKNTDLSPFGLSVYDWNLVEISRMKDEYKIWLNGKQAYAVRTEQSIGQIIGINVNFTGSGSMDFVEFRNSETNKIVYFDDFKVNKKASEL